MYIFKYIASVCSIILVLINLVLLIFYPSKNIIGLIDLIGFGLQMVSYFILLSSSESFNKMKFRDLWFVFLSVIVFPAGTIIGLVLLLI